MSKKIPRRHAIPILYTSGTHYEVGFDMGRTFESIIKSFIKLSEPLQLDYIPLYQTEKGKEIYNETLNSVKKSFPQYIRELEGIADGAQVEFYKLFLLHMDDITPNCAKKRTTPLQPIGCSTIMINEPDCHILGHTEDALSETLNHFYYVAAHIKEDSPQGKYKVKEEHFMSLCYAGHLPGYTMNFNYHGLVFSINTLSASDLKCGKTPRHFITRALLSAENYKQAVNILKDPGVGAADGCSINLTFLNEKGPRKFYNIEMAPVLDGKDESRLDIHEVNEGERSFHCNRYLRIHPGEINPGMQASSESRMKAFETYYEPKTKHDVINILSDQSLPEHPIFRENNEPNELVKTIAIGIFDLDDKNLFIYSDRPSHNEPNCKIPLELGIKK